MTIVAFTAPAEERRPNRRRRYLMAAVGLVAFFVLLTLLPIDSDAFPTAWGVDLADGFDRIHSWVYGARVTHPIFVHIVEPIAKFIDELVQAVERLLVGLPWLAVVLAVFFVAYKAGGQEISALAIFGLLIIGMFGLWEESIQTLALLLVSVAFAVIIGIPLGLLSARYDWLHRVLRPILDVMQSVPALVYLLPFALVFGAARVPAVIATLIYALPPAIRLTDTGIRDVPAAAVEAADALGSTTWQKLRKVQLPLARPRILVGVNQSLLMALGLVVVGALIGAPGLGTTVYQALEQGQAGRSLEAGLAIALIAVIFDRIATSYRVESEAALTRQERPGAFSQVSPFLLNYTYWSTALLVFLLVLFVDALTGAFSTFPESLQISIAGPADGFANWIDDHFDQIGNLPIGTGSFNAFVTTIFLDPLRSLLQNWLPWPVVFAGVGLLCYFVSGWRLATFSLFSLFLIGIMGLWAATMDTLSQVLVAALFAIVIGVPLGILAARHDRFERVLQPIMDLLLAIPALVYLVPMVMLFNDGRVPGIMAAVLYAIPPMVRLTDRGIRRVPRTAIEAADFFGATAGQKLVKVQLSLAKHSIMAGVNQTIIMVMAMVILAELVGGGALGQAMVSGLTGSHVARGIGAGLAIVILSIILDRLTKAWAAGDSFDGLEQ